MSPTPSLPLEILEHIIQDLPRDKPTQLKKCSLVCWTFVPICRKYLFAAISLHIYAGYPKRSVENLSALLRKSPEIATYTRHLELHFSLVPRPPSSFLRDDEWTVPLELKMFSRLESYRLSFYPSWDASIQSSLIPIPCNDARLLIPRDILFRPMPTLRILKLERIKNFPFHNCPNIRELVFSDMEEVLAQDGSSTTTSTGQLPLKSIKLDSFCVDGRSQADSISDVQKILGLQQSNGQPVFDISDLKHFKLNMCDNLEWNVTLAPVLLQTNQLTTLTLTGGGVLNLAGIGQLFLASRMTLKEIDISTEAEEEWDNDPWHGLCEELEILGRQPNVLESLTYRLFICCGSRCSTGDEWGALDGVIDTFAWPKLKKIVINIESSSPELTMEEMRASDYDEGEMDPDEAQFKRRLELLRRRRFPILFKKAKSKHLDFKINVRWY